MILPAELFGGLSELICAVCLGLCLALCGGTQHLAVNCPSCLDLSDSKVGSMVKFSSLTFNRENSLIMCATICLDTHTTHTCIHIHTTHTTYIDTHNTHTTHTIHIHIYTTHTTCIHIHISHIYMYTTHSIHTLNNIDSHTTHIFHIYTYTLHTHTNTHKLASQLLPLGVLGFVFETESHDIALVSLELSL